MDKDEIHNSINPLANRQSFSDVALSLMSHVIHKINLFVEGESDVNFYRSLRILDEEKIKIQEIKQKRKYLVKNYGKVEGKTAVLTLIEDRLNKRKSDLTLTEYYGIVDQDYNGLLTDKFTVGKYVITTDARDLETTLLQLDMENIAQQFTINNHASIILPMAIEYASYIGKLRTLRQERNDTIPNNSDRLYKKIRVNFTNQENFSLHEYSLTTANTTYIIELNGYYEFLKNNFSFDTYKYLGSSSVVSINKIHNNIARYKKSSLFYCRGHDIFDFVAVLCYRFGLLQEHLLAETCKRKGICDNAKTKGISLTDLRSTYEEQIESYFDREKFKKTKLYDFFIMLNNLVNYII